MLRAEHIFTRTSMLTYSSFASLAIVAGLMPVFSFAHCCYFTLRSGGKTFITFLFDAGVQWVVSVPAAFILYFAGLSIYWVFPIVQALMLIKATVGLVLVCKKVWVRTLI